MHADADLQKFKADQKIFRWALSGQGSLKLTVSKK